METQTPPVLPETLGPAREPSTYRRPPNVSPLAAQRMWSLAYAMGHGCCLWFLESVLGSLNEVPQERHRAMFEQAGRLFVARQQELQAMGADWQNAMVARCARAAEADGHDWPYQDFGLRHTTGSGTLSWEIRPDGGVTLTARVREKPGAGKTKVIAALFVRAVGSPRLEVYGDFPASNGAEAWQAKNYDSVGPEQYDYTWEVLGQAARACGVTLPRRPVHHKKLLPRGRRGIAAVA